MVDWDEFLEDVNWKKGIAFTVAGLVVIAGAIFVLLDYWRMNQLASQLKTDLQSIKSFRDTWKEEILSAEEIKEAEKEKAAYQQELAELGLRLPMLELKEEKARGAGDTAGEKMVTVESRYRPRLEPELKKLAAAKGVTLLEQKWSNDRVDGFAAISAVELKVKGGTRESAAFLSSIYQLQCPHPEEAGKTIPCPVADKSPEQSLEGTKRFLFEFYSFDQKKWERIRDCTVNIDVPQIKTRSGKSYLFQNRIARFQAEVERELAAMADIPDRVKKACRVQKERDRYKTELEIIRTRNLTRQP